MYISKLNTFNYFSMSSSVSFKSFISPVSPPDQRRPNSRDFGTNRYCSRSRECTPHPSESERQMRLHIFWACVCLCVNLNQFVGGVKIHVCVCVVSTH